MSIEYFEVDLDRVVEVSRSVLEKFDFIEIAVIFGSALRRGVVRDIDVGLVLNTEPSLRVINEVASALEQELGVPVDIVILNEAPPLLRFKALVEGVKITVRNKSKYYYLVTEAFMELEDMREKLNTLSSNREHYEL
ncbi:MAG: nucleotidyltransferase domain-containing protein [Desulfurococcaceae archaeon]|nr:nucleotidyltransferase domain-containing protein [Desulfurococcaceae archaeon]